jgi:uncharacterized membrane protein
MTSGAAPYGAGRGTDVGVGTTGPRQRPRRSLRRLWYVLLVVEVVAVLIPSIYGRITPKLFGFPFFYWYQLAWILVSMVLTGLVYLFTVDRRREGQD